MSHQLALSSLFSVLALGALCLASVNGVVGDGGGLKSADTQFSLQAEHAPGLTG